MTDQAHGSTTTRRPGLCGLLGLLPFIAVGIGLIGLLIWTGHTWYQLRYQSGDATGVITALSTGSGGKGGTRYNVDYSFEVSEHGDPTTYTGQSNVDYEFYQYSAVGDAVPVRYVTDDPSISEMEIALSPTLPLFLLCFAGFWNGLIGIIIVSVIKTMRQGRRE